VCTRVRSHGPHNPQTWLAANPGPDPKTPRPVDFRVLGFCVCCVFPCLSVCCLVACCVAMCVCVLSRRVCCQFVSCARDVAAVVVLKIFIKIYKNIIKHTRDTHKKISDCLRQDESATIGEAALTLASNLTFARRISLSSRSGPYRGSHSDSPTRYSLAVH
jgi:hypothetical protein